LTLPRNIILVGFSGTGKSQVGREVSRLLGWEFVDTDEAIERMAGKPVRRIFAEEGEPAFRDLEKRALREACGGQGRVISTGGGAPVDPENRCLMLGAGLVVCLDASPETIYARLMGNGGDPAEERPMLAGPQPLERIRTLRKARRSCYGAAHRTVNTDGLTVEETAREVLRVSAAKLEGGLDD
jgi:shikimate kinase